MRKIYTTISVDQEIFFRLRTMRKRKQILKTAVEKSIRYYCGKYSSERIRHQKYTGGMGRVSVSIPVEGYELLTDTRSLGKLSISYMIGSMLKELLDNNGNMPEKKFDNYRISDYQVRFDHATDVFKTEITWHAERICGRTSRLKDLKE